MGTDGEGLQKQSDGVFSSLGRGNEDGPSCVGERSNREAGRLKKKTKKEQKKRTPGTRGVETAPLSHRILGSGHKGENARRRN